MSLEGKNCLRSEPNHHGAGGRSDVNVVLSWADGPVRKAKITEKTKEYKKQNEKDMLSVKPLALSSCRQE